MNRRNFLGTTALGAGGFALGVGATEPSCNPKSVNLEIQTVESFLRVVAVEIPSQSAFITKILKVADDFNADYQRGDFDSAGAFFATLESDITQLITDAGANLSARVKIALVLIDAAVTAIAGLLKSQQGAPGVPSKAAMSPEQRTQADVIEKRAARIEKLYAVLQPVK